jgi:hypothetical protein
MISQDVRIPVLRLSTTFFLRVFNYLPFWVTRNSREPWFIMGRAGKCRGNAYRKPRPPLQES